MTQFDPERADRHFSAANTLMQAGRFADAAQEYERALVLNPAAPRTHNNLAVAYAEQKLFDRALAH